MKFLIISDIHGDAKALESLLLKFKSEGYDKLLILGDILYHGPRNNLPNGYAPKEVITLLNAISDKIIAVRGNCDTEVDQMVLNFPILSDTSFVFDSGIEFFLTHGHKFTPQSPAPMAKGTIMLAGHTHIPTITEIENGCFYVNPGSISIPKGDFDASFAVYENKVITVFTFDGRIVTQRKF